MRIFFFTMLVLFSFASVARADENSDVKSIIGVDMHQLQACERDGDCTLIEDFRECCKWLGVNAKYRDLTADHHSELFQTLATPEKQSFCAKTDCEMPKASAVCELGQCVAK